MNQFRNSAVRGAAHPVRHSALARHDNPVVPARHAAVHETVMTAETIDVMIGGIIDGTVIEMTTGPGDNTGKRSCIWQLFT